MAATNTNIKINIVEPGGVDPATGTTGISAPDTGLFTHSIGGPEATAIGVVLVLTITAIIMAILYRKHKRQGKVTKLVHTIDSTKAVFKSKKRITAGLSAIALLASAGTLTTLLTNAGKSNTNAAEGDGLTLDVSSEDLTIEVGDSPVFAVLPVELTVEEATPAGYTLTAYTEDTDLVSTTDSANTIPMAAASEDLSALTDNTWGLSLGQPQDENSEVYTTLSTDQSNPTILKSIDDYSETEENDTTIIYYGFYITPDIPYGTYEGSEINYEAEPNYITNLSFDGNGNDGGVDMEGMTIIAGDTITLPVNTYTKEGYNFIGWNTVVGPTEQDSGEAYEGQAEYTAIEGKTNDVTLYAQWKKNLPSMQDVASWGSGLQIGDEIIVVDDRDNKEYTVARLADNNIWMTQNLDFDIANGGVDLNSTNTDVPANWVDAGNLTNTYATDDTTWNHSNITPESYDPGNLYWNGALIYDKATCEEYGGSWKTSSYSNPYCVNASPTTSTGDSHYHLGNYYNWTAAVAMNDSSLYTKFGQDANQSICPAGWRLPTRTGDKSYDNLVSVENLTSGIDGNIQNSPTHFVYGGRWGGNSDKIGENGNYSSSAVNDRSCSFSIHFEVQHNVLYPYSYGDKNYGYSLRCVAR